MTNLSFKTRAITLSLLLLFSSSCTTNNFSDYYEEIMVSPHCSSQKSKRVRNRRGHTPLKKDILVIGTTEYSERIESFIKKGYVVIGRSTFQGTWEPRKFALQTAQKYHADIVILTSTLVQERTQMNSVPMPQVNVMAYSGGGVGVGASTQQVNYLQNIRIWEHKATFLARSNKSNKKEEE